MIKEKLLVKKLHDDAVIPTKAHDSDLGYDLYALETMYIHPFATKVRTGIALGFPKGWGGFIKDRSSMAAKSFMTSGGVIDETYTGEISVIIKSSEMTLIKKGDKIAQIVPIPTTNWTIEEVSELKDSERSTKGFGSSGSSATDTCVGGM